MGRTRPSSDRSVTVDRRLLLADMELAATVRRYYVATNGSDSNSGSKTRPWKSIYAAINKMTHGGILYVRGGTYSYSRREHHRRPPVVDDADHVTNYPGETPVFKTTSTQAIFMWFRNAANITVQHLIGLRRPEQPDPRQPRRRDLPVHREHLGHRPERQQGLRRPQLGQHPARRLHRGRHRPRHHHQVEPFDGQGGDGAGFHSYHDPNGRRITVRNNTFHEVGHLRPGLVEHLRPRHHADNTITACRIGIRYHDSRGTAASPATGPCSNSHDDPARHAARTFSESSNSWN